METKLSRISHVYAFNSSLNMLEREAKMMVPLWYIHATLGPFLCWLSQSYFTSSTFRLNLRSEPSCSQATMSPLAKLHILQDCKLSKKATSVLSPKLLPDKSCPFLPCNLNSPLKCLLHLIYTHLKPSAKDWKAQHARMLNFSRLSQQTWPLGIRICMVTCQQLLRCVSTLRWPANVSRRALSWIMCV